MSASIPVPGDFVVEYRHLSRGRGAARVVVVHLTRDAGPEELFSSRASRSGERAEGLAALWAREDGTCAWRVVRNDHADAVAERLGIHGGARPPGAEP
jgi:hypothetical protein